jgi:hypothetical protein
MADTGPMGGGGGGNVPRPISCDSPQCQSALSAVATDRNRVLSKCAQVEATKGRRDLLAIIAGALLTAGLAALAAAAAATSTFFGIPAAIVLLLVAVSLLATALLFAIAASSAAIQYGIQQAELNSERARFTDDATKVTMSCPSICWGDLTLPACPD